MIPLKYMSESWDDAEVLKTIGVWPAVRKVPTSGGPPGFGWALSGQGALPLGGGHPAPTGQAAPPTLRLSWPLAR